MASLGALAAPQRRARTIRDRKRRARTKRVERIYAWRILVRICSEHVSLSLVQGAKLGLSDDFTLKDRTVWLTSAFRATQHNSDEREKAYVNIVALIPSVLFLHVRENLFFISGFNRSLRWRRLFAAPVARACAAQLNPRCCSSFHSYFFRYECVPPNLTESSRISQLDTELLLCATAEESATLSAHLKHSLARERFARCWVGCFTELLDKMQPLEQDDEELEHESTASNAPPTQSQRRSQPKRK